MIIVSNIPAMFKNYQKREQGITITKNSKAIKERFADVLASCIQAMDKERVNK